MNFDYSGDAKALRDQADAIFATAASSIHLHRLVEAQATTDTQLWRTMASLGWVAPQVEEDLGGAGAGPETICALAEAVGAALAPVPYMSSTVMMVEAIRLAGTPAQCQAWLPGLAAGTTIGTVALWDRGGASEGAFSAARAASGTLSACKTVVPDGMVADVCVTPAVDEAGAMGLYVLRLDDLKVTRRPLPTLDLLRGHALLMLENVPAERLGPSSADRQGADELLDAWLDRIATYQAFEQLGGAQACLAMAVQQAKDRVAFGRPIGSFQGIKHKLADMYVAIELARSNCYYAASELQAGSSGLRLAAAAARQSASAAYELAAKENIQTHGGFGFTWEADCHLHYRRSKSLAVALGSPARWRDRLVDAMTVAR